MFVYTRLVNENHCLQQKQYGIISIMVLFNYFYYWRWTDKVIIFQWLLWCWVQLLVKCTHFSIFSSHTGFFSPSQISLTPESSRRLLFRFISFRMVLEERTVARTEQLFSVSSQLFSLNTKTLFVIQNRSDYQIFIYTRGCTD